MLNKITLSILSIVLWMSVFTEAKIQPYSDSFDVVKSLGFAHTATLEALYDAEQARVHHGANLTEVTDYIRRKFDSRLGYDWHCFGSVGEIGSSFWARFSYIYLKSDTADDMNILCMRTTTALGDHTVLT